MCLLLFWLINFARILLLAWNVQWLHKKRSTRTSSTESNGSTSPPWNMRQQPKKSCCQTLQVRLSHGWCLLQKEELLFWLFLILIQLLMISLEVVFSVIQQEKGKLELNSGIENFDTAKLKHAEMHEKNPLPTKEVIDQEKSA